MQLLLFIVFFISTVPSEATWKEKLKRRVSTATVENGDGYGETESVDYYPFNVERDITSLCSALSCRKITSSNSTSFSQSRYLRDRKPVVLSLYGDSPVQNWKALRWNLWYWASILLPTLNGVLSQERGDDDMVNNIFLVQEVESTYENYLNEILSFPKYEIDDQILLWDFLNDIGNRRQKSVKYKDQAPDISKTQKTEYCRFFSQDFNEMEKLMKIEADTTWRTLLIKEELGFLKSEELFVAPLFNMLYPGCSLQTRYSEYHTVRVQVQGKGRYYIFPPSTLSELYPFPSTSPSANQMQANLYKAFSNHKETESAIDLEPLEKLSVEYIVLSPGETLFIPPGYAVLSEALTLSVTIDILSPSAEQILFMEAILTPLPLSRYADQQLKNPPSLSFDEKAIYVQVFLAHIISRIEGVSSIGRYIRKLYKSRYSLLHPIDSLEMQNLAQSFDCYKNRANFHEKIVKSFCGFFFIFCCYPRMNPEEVEKVATYVSKKFNNPLLLATGSKWVLLGNYIEQVVRNLWEGYADAWVPLYLITCLDIDAKIKVVEEVEGPPVMKLNPIY